MHAWLYRWPFSIDILGNLTVNSPQTCVCMSVHTLIVRADFTLWLPVSLNSRKLCVPGVGLKANVTAKGKWFTQKTMRRVRKNAYHGLKKSHTTVLLNSLAGEQTED